MSQSLGSITRRGMTLVELLVVIMIMVILMGIALPLIKPQLEDRKLREASRQLNAFIRAAQARAAETDRPVGISIVRNDELNPNISYQVYYAETPPPYAGDTQDAAVTALAMVSTSTPPYNLGPPLVRYKPTVTQALPWLNTFPPQWLMRLAISDAYGVQIVQTEGAANVSAIVKRGDTIRFNYTGPDYLVYDVCTNAHWMTADDYNTATAESVANGDLYAGVSPSPGQIIIGPKPSDPQTQLWPPSAAGPIFVGSRFQINRQPQRTTAGALTLPDTTAIILSMSGFHGALAQEFNLPAPDEVITDLNEFAGNWIDDISGTPTTMIDPTPITVMFRPDGSVDKVYYRNNGGELADAPLHFMVGRARRERASTAEPQPPESLHRRQAARSRRRPAHVAEPRRPAQPLGDDPPSHGDGHHDGHGGLARERCGIRPLERHAREENPHRPHFHAHRPKRGRQIMFSLFSTADCRLPTAFPCRGVTVLEVLIAIGVAAVGLLGVILLVPLADHQMNRGLTLERANQVGANAFREFEVHGMHNPSNWRIYQRAECQLFGAAHAGLARRRQQRRVRAVRHGQWHAGSISPRLCHRPALRGELYRRHARRADQRPRLSVPQPAHASALMPRLTLPALAAGAGVMSLACRRDLHFQRRLGFPPSQRRPHRAAVATGHQRRALAIPRSRHGRLPHARQSHPPGQGRSSWIATVVPQEPTGVASRLGDQYVLSVVVFQQRDGALLMDEVNERMFACSGHRLIQRL